MYVSLYIMSSLFKNTFQMYPEYVFKYFVFYILNKYSNTFFQKHLNIYTNIILETKFKVGNTKILVNTMVKLKNI